MSTKTVPKTPTKAKLNVPLLKSLHKSMKLDGASSFFHANDPFRWLYQIDGTINQEITNDNLSEIQKFKEARTELYQLLKEFHLLSNNFITLSETNSITNIEKIKNIQNNIAEIEYKMIKLHNNYSFGYKWDLASKRYIHMSSTISCKRKLFVDDNAPESIQEPDLKKIKIEFGFKELCDITLCYGDKEFHTHRIKLAEKSVWFKEIFEAKQILSEPIITLHVQNNITTKHIEMFLKYFYDEKLSIYDVGDTDNLKALAHLARYYLVEKLEELIKSLIIGWPIKGSKAGEIWGFLDVAVQYDWKEIRTILENILSENIRYYKNSDDCKEAFQKYWAIIPPRVTEKLMYRLLEKTSIQAQSKEFFKRNVGINATEKKVLKQIVEAYNYQFPTISSVDLYRPIAHHLMEYLDIQLQKQPWYALHRSLIDGLIHHGMPIAVATSQNIF